VKRIPKMRDTSWVTKLISLLLAALLQSSVTGYFPLFGAEWVPVVQVVAALAVLQGPLAGATWGFVGGLLLDLFSGAPWGTSALALTLAGTLGGFAYTVVLPHRLLLAISTSFWVGLVYYLVLLFLLLTLGYQLVLVQGIWRRVASTVILNALLAPLVFTVVSRLVEATAGSAGGVRS
jgi:rod shape-determining protein MreD